MTKTGSHLARRELGQSIFSFFEAWQHSRITGGCGISAVFPGRFRHCDERHAFSGWFISQEQNIEIWLEDSESPESMVPVRIALTTGDCTKSPCALVLGENALSKWLSFTPDPYAVVSVDLSDQKYNTKAGEGLNLTWGQHFDV